MRPLVPHEVGTYPVGAAAADATSRGYALQAAHEAALASDGVKLKRPLPSKDAGPNHADRVPYEWWVLRRFIEETCHVDKVSPDPKMLRSHV